MIPCVFTAAVLTHLTSGAQAAGPDEDGRLERAFGAATDVVVGRITSVNVDHAPDGMPTTRVTVAVHHVARGDATLQSVVLSFEGGRSRDGNFTYFVHHAPVTVTLLKEGTEGLFAYIRGETGQLGRPIDHPLAVYLRVADIDGGDCGQAGNKQFLIDATDLTLEDRKMFLPWNPRYPKDGSTGPRVACDGAPAWEETVERLKAGIKTADSTLGDSPSTAPSP